MRPLPASTGGRLHCLAGDAPAPCFAWRPTSRLPFPILRAVWVSGVLQTALYGDFFYYYLKCLKGNKKLSLPA
jgi:hypothetical protein